MYIATIIVSFISLILNILFIFAEEDSSVLMFYGEKELIILTVISIVLLVLGIIIDLLGERSIGGKDETMA